MDLPSAAVVSVLQSRPRPGESPSPGARGGDGDGARGIVAPKGLFQVAPKPAAPSLPAPLMFPVAASKPGLAARAPSRKKKNKKGPVIKITEMSEKFLSQESEVSE